MLSVFFNEQETETMKIQCHIPILIFSLMLCWAGCKEPVKTPAVVQEIVTPAVTEVAEEAVEKVEEVTAVVEKPMPNNTEAKSEQVQNSTVSRAETTTSAIEEKVKSSGQVVPTTKPQVEIPKSVKVVKPAKEKVKKEVEPDVPSSKPARLPKPIPVEEVQEVKVDGQKKTAPRPTPPPAAPSHQLFNEILSNHVSSSGNVDYAGIKQGKEKLDSYLQQLEKVDVNSLDKSERLAFWINAYNAYTIKKIIDNYPLKSITDLDGGKPWDVKWIKLNNQTLSLNNIENDIIRPTFNEPRIHFAVNCAARSCPPLLNKAWTAGNMESHFEKQTKKFINNPQYNVLGAEPKVSKIFEWYAKDFGDLRSFINKYADAEIADGVTIGYKEYDWALNN